MITLSRRRLTLNCRNTRRIAEETAIIGGFDTPPFKLSREMGMPVVHRHWRTSPDLVIALEETVRSLVNDGLQMHDIIILSPKRLENSTLATVEQICGVPLVDCSR